MATFILCGGLFSGAASDYRIEIPVGRRGGEAILFDIRALLDYPKVAMGQIIEN
jgi:hypothetical protein